MSKTCETSDLLVFSHTRWNEIYDRPQHLLSRYTRNRRVFYFEEAITGKVDFPHIHIQTTHEHVKVVTPHLPAGLNPEATEFMLKELVDQLIDDEHISRFNIMYYNPMALTYSRHLTPEKIIYDCTEDQHFTMLDPQVLSAREIELMDRAHLVFTSNDSLYDSKKYFHNNMHVITGSRSEESWDEAFAEMVAHENELHYGHSHSKPAYMDPALIEIGLA